MYCSATILVACFTVALDDVATFHIKPYLQWPERDSISVMWETTEPTCGEVRYGTTPELDLRGVEPDARSVHEVRLAGLLPRTRYFYQVRCGELKSDVATFRTSPPPGERWRLVVYGDSRSFPERHQQVAELAERLEPDLVLHTGDQVTRGSQRPLWKAQFFDPAARLFGKVPVITCLGNHEENAGNYFEYLALPGNERFFSLDFADLHLVVLDSNAWGKSARESDQYKWLQADLSRPRSARWTAVAFHHPLFSAHDKRAINPARWDWCPEFQDRGVDLVLTGHDHFYYRSWPIGRLGEHASRGITHITTAGGGAPLYRMKGRSYTAIEQAVHHVSLLEFDGSEIHGLVVDVAGREVDRYIINKDPTPAEEFCAYEVYELERAIRRELESRPPTLAAPTDKSVMVRDELRVPHEFRVPVAARLVWDDADSSESDASVEVRLVPGEALCIPIVRQVSLDTLAPRGDREGSDRLPRMHLQFLDERFRNRDIEFGPLKIWRDVTIHSRPLPGSPQAAALLSETSLDLSEPFSFVRCDGTERARVPAYVRLGHTSDQLFAVVTVASAQGSTETDLQAAIHRDPADLMKGKHVRLALSNGDHTYGFAVSLDGRRADNRDGDWSFDDPDWTAHVRRQDGSCVVCFMLPRRIAPSGSNLRINVVYSDPADEIDGCLSPTFDVGNDPDRIPDYRFGDRSVNRFARLILD